MYWHVDDLAATFDKLLTMCATVYEAVTSPATPSSSQRRSSTRSGTCSASGTTPTTSKRSTAGTRQTE